jgi:HTH-type transcriptional regulator / antitoxin HigA
MNIKPLKNDSDYQEALEMLDKVFDSEPGTKNGDILELLSILIDDYEKNHYPIALPDPIEAIKFRMEQMDYSQNDFANIIGLKSKASEILNKKRKLSLNMIRKIHTFLNIPTEVLIQAY